MKKLESFFILLKEYKRKYKLCKLRSGNVSIAINRTTKAGAETLTNNKSETP